MQAHHVLEPIFYRLGMKLVTKNIAQGGLGTTQTALGKNFCWYICSRHVLSFLIIS